MKTPTQRLFGGGPWILYPLALLLIIGINRPALAQDPDLVKLLPPDSAFECLTLTSEVESYAGDELFFLINGGADLYLEYGFIQVISAEYSNEAGNSLTVEIYEMKDRFASYGIYSFQQLYDDKPDQIGERGQIIKNNALLVKDRFVIKLFSRFPEDKLEELLKNTADLIAAKIESGDDRPLLLPYMLPVRDNDYPQVKLIRGNVALRNIYNFHNEDIFKMEQGVVGLYQDYNIFIFQYPGSLKAMQQFGLAESQLEKDQRFSSFYSQKNQFQMIDSKGNKVHCLAFDRFIIIFIYQGTRNLSPLIEEIKFNIDLSK